MNFSDLVQKVFIHAIIELFFLQVIIGELFAQELGTPFLLFRRSPLLSYAFPRGALIRFPTASDASSATRTKLHAPSLALGIYEEEPFLMALATATYWRELTSGTKMMHLAFETKGAKLERIQQMTKITQ